MLNYELKHDTYGVAIDFLDTNVEAKSFVVDRCYLTPRELALIEGLEPGNAHQWDAETHEVESPGNFGWQASRIKGTDIVLFKWGYFECMIPLNELWKFANAGEPPSDEDFFKQGSNEERYSVERDPKGVKVTLKYHTALSCYFTNQNLLDIEEIPRGQRYYIHTEEGKSWYVEKAGSYFRVPTVGVGILGFSPIYIPMSQLMDDLNTDAEPPSDEEFFKNAEDSWAGVTQHGKIEWHGWAPTITIYYNKNGVFLRNVNQVTLLREDVIEILNLKDAKGAATPYFPDKMSERGFAKADELTGQGWIFHKLSEDEIQFQVGSFKGRLKVDGLLAANSEEAEISDDEFFKNSHNRVPPTYTVAHSARGVQIRVSWTNNYSLPETTDIWLTNKDLVELEGLADEDWYYVETPNHIRQGRWGFMRWGEHTVRLHGGTFTIDIDMNDLATLDSEEGETPSDDDFLKNGSSVYDPDYFGTPHGVKIRFFDNGTFRECLIPNNLLFEIESSHDKLDFEAIEWREGDIVWKVFTRTKNMVWLGGTYESLRNTPEETAFGCILDYYDLMDAAKRMDEEGEGEEPSDEDFLKNSSQKGDDYIIQRLNVWGMPVVQITLKATSQYIKLRHEDITKLALLPVKGWYESPGNWVWEKIDENRLELFVGYRNFIIPLEDLMIFEEGEEPSDEDFLKNSSRLELDKDYPAAFAERNSLGMMMEFRSRIPGRAAQFTQFPNQAVLSIDENALNYKECNFVADNKEWSVNVDRGFLWFFILESNNIWFLKGRMLCEDWKNAPWEPVVDEPEDEDFFKQARRVCDECGEYADVSCTVCGCALCTTHVQDGMCSLCYDEVNNPVCQECGVPNPERTKCKYCEDLMCPNCLTEKGYCGHCSREVEDRQIANGLADITEQTEDFDDQPTPSDEDFLKEGNMKQAEVKTSMVEGYSFEYNGNDVVLISPDKKETLVLTGSEAAKFKQELAQIELENQDDGALAHLVDTAIAHHFVNKLSKTSSVSTIAYLESLGFKRHRETSSQDGSEPAFYHPDPQMYPEVRRYLLGIYRNTGETDKNKGEMRDKHGVHMNLDAPDGSWVQISKVLHGFRGCPRGCYVSFLKGWKGESPQIKQPEGNPVTEEVSDEEFFKNSSAKTAEVPVPGREVLIPAANEVLKYLICATLTTKFAHWNVKGEGFHPTHKLFDDIYEFFSDASDMVAERITALGGIAEGLLPTVATAKFTYLASGTDDVATHTAAMADLLTKCSEMLRRAAQTSEVDLFTQDLYIELGREVEKLLYFLDASLSGETPMEKTGASGYGFKKRVQENPYMPQLEHVMDKFPEKRFNGFTPIGDTDYQVSCNSLEPPLVIVRLYLKAGDKDPVWSVYHQGRRLTFGHDATSLLLWLDKNTEGKNPNETNMRYSSSPFANGHSHPLVQEGALTEHKQAYIDDPTCYWGCEGKVYRCARCKNFFCPEHCNIDKDDIPWCPFCFPHREEYLLAWRDKNLKDADDYLSHEPEPSDEEFLKNAARKCLVCKQNASLTCESCFEPICSEHKQSFEGMDFCPSCLEDIQNYPCAYCSKTCNSDCKLCTLPICEDHNVGGYCTECIDRKERHEIALRTNELDNLGEEGTEPSDEEFLKQSHRHKFIWGVCNCGARETDYLRRCWFYGHDEGGCQNYTLEHCAKCNRDICEDHLQKRGKRVLCRYCAEKFDDAGAKIERGLNKIRRDKDEGEAPSDEEFFKQGAHPFGDLKDQQVAPDPDDHCYTCGDEAIVTRCNNCLGYICKDCRKLDSKGRSFCVDCITDAEKRYIQDRDTQINWLDKLDPGTDTETPEDEEFFKNAASYRCGDCNRLTQNRCSDCGEGICLSHRKHLDGDIYCLDCYEELKDEVEQCNEFDCKTYTIRSCSECKLPYCKEHLDKVKIPGKTKIVCEDCEEELADDYMCVACPSMETYPCKNCLNKGCSEHLQHDLCPQCQHLKERLQIEEHTNRLENIPDAIAPGADVSDDEFFKNAAAAICIACDRPAVNKCSCCGVDVCEDHAERNLFEEFPIICPDCEDDVMHAERDTNGEEIDEEALCDYCDEPTQGKCDVCDCTFCATHAGRNGQCEDCSKDIERKALDNRIKQINQIQQSDAPDEISDEDFGKVPVE